MFEIYKQQNWFYHYSWIGYIMVYTDNEIKYRHCMSVLMI